jgi:hypothetical protein
MPRIAPRATADWDDAVFDALSVLTPLKIGAPPEPVDGEQPESNTMGVFVWHLRWPKAGLLSTATFPFDAARPGSGAGYRAPRGFGNRSTSAPSTCGWRGQRQ